MWVSTNITCLLVYKVKIRAINNNNHLKVYINIKWKICHIINKKKKWINKNVNKQNISILFYFIYLFSNMTSCKSFYKSSIWQCSLHLCTLCDRETSPTKFKIRLFIIYWQHCVTVLPLQIWRISSILSMHSLKSPSPYCFVTESVQQRYVIKWASSDHALR